MNGDDDDDGVSGCEGYYIASREGFLGGGSFIYIYIYISPSYLERGREREEGKERVYKGTTNKFFNLRLT